MIELDGSHGEGGGQILRSALTLAMCTGTPFRITKIRAGRQKPGLLRQHLTAVNAAATVSGARVDGAALGSPELLFEPGEVRGGDYRFAIGSAGSCTLVLQTLLPALLLADRPSRVSFSGGTHNAMAPPFHFIDRSFLPLLRRMGAQADVHLDRFGFYPAGGGEIVAEITPTGAFTPLSLPARGQRLSAMAESYIAGVPAHVAKRELATVADGLGWAPEQLKVRQVRHEEGPGNALLVTLAHEHVTEVFCGFGEKGVSAEKVASDVVDEVRAYLASDAAAGEYLADQLLLPMALAGTGDFSASTLSMHTKTNIEVIEKFLPVEFTTTEKERGWDVRVAR